MSMNVPALSVANLSHLWQAHRQPFSVSPSMMSALSRHAECLSIALSGRDAHTHAHCDRVLRWALDVGKRCRFSEYELAILGTAAQLHDIGKIGVPDRILLKRGPLDHDEREQMKAHSELGQRICSAVPEPVFAEVGTLIRHHHEAFDGSGYPDGLRGESIPVGARIIAICDCFDALVSTRPYHEARDPQQTLALMNEDSGHKFDPWLFDQFALARPM